MAWRREGALGEGWGKLSRPSNYEGKRGDTHCHIFLLAKEAHSDVIPEWRAFYNSTRYNFVFGEGNIKVPMGLHHAACCQDGLVVGRVVSQCVSKMFKCLLVNAELGKKQTRELHQGRWR